MGCLFIFSATCKITITVRIFPGNALGTWQHAQNMAHLGVAMSSGIWLL